MNHQDAWELLDPYLDGTLPAADRWAIAAHLDECPICRRQLANQARMLGQVRERIADIAPPSGLEQRLQSTLATDRAAAAAPASRSWPTALGLRLATVVGPALAALWLLARVTAPVAGSNPDLPAELAATHALFAQDESLLDVAGDASATTAWFRETAGLIVSAPGLDGYELLGGRLIALHGQPVAQLVYESPGEDYLSLLHFDSRGSLVPHEDELAALAVDLHGTVSVLTWPAGGGRSALIGDLDVSELRRVAQGLASWPQVPEVSGSAAE